MCRSETHVANMTEEILRLIADYLDVPFDELTPDKTLVDLGADSVDVFEILFEIEEKYGIRFSGDASDLRKRILSIADVIRLTAELQMPDPAQPVRPE